MQVRVVGTDIQDNMIIGYTLQCRNRMTFSISKDELVSRIKSKDLEVDGLKLKRGDRLLCNKVISKDSISSFEQMVDIEINMISTVLSSCGVNTQFRLMDSKCEDILQWEIKLYASNKGLLLDAFILINADRHYTLYCSNEKTLNFATVDTLIQYLVKFIREGIGV